ncbi:MAG: hypothetical protein WC749_04850 [Dehalococcoidia bacterium]
MVLKRTGILPVLFRTSLIRGGVALTGRVRGDLQVKSGKLPYPSTMLKTSSGRAEKIICSFVLSFVEA